MPKIISFVFLSVFGLITGVLIGLTIAPSIEDLASSTQAFCKDRNMRYIGSYKKENSEFIFMCKTQRRS